MRFSFIPREMKFFDLFDEAVAILSRAAARFLDLVTVFDDQDERSTDLKKEETALDDVVGRIIQALDRSFITPFDREDIHTLATSLDDVLDNMEEAAHRFVLYKERPTPEAIALAGIVRDCCTHLEQAVRACRTLRKPEEIQSHLREVTRLENDADRLYRDSEAALFADPPKDLLRLIKWRDLYSWLEETVDACKSASQVISEIVIKGS
jgi:uncharacterized protein Yka (UPF0111/DUF47 family)